jgi:hypothetical protein
VLVNRTTGAVVQRGFAGRNGVAHARPLIIGANRDLRETILQADSFWLASQDYRTGENGSSLTLPAFRRRIRRRGIRRGHRSDPGRL